MMNKKIFDKGAIYRCVKDDQFGFKQGQDYVAVTEHELVNDNDIPMLPYCCGNFIKVAQESNPRQISFVEQDNEKERVNHPQHYLQGGIECFDVIERFYGKQALEDFCLCNSLKYQMRCRLKDNYIDDLKKAKFYIGKIIEMHNGKQ